MVSELEMVQLQNEKLKLQLRQRKMESLHRARTKRGLRAVKKNLRLSKKTAANFSRDFSKGSFVVKRKARAAGSRVKGAIFGEGIYKPGLKGKIQSFLAKRKKRIF